MMASVGRYFNCPQVRKIHGNRRTLREWLLLKLKRRETPDMYPICDYYSACYPSGYKK